MDVGLGTDFDLGDVSVLGVEVVAFLIDLVGEVLLKITGLFLVRLG
jgi:hypothetical protein